MAALYWFSDDFCIGEYQAILCNHAITTESKAIKSSGH